MSRSLRSLLPALASETDAAAEDAGCAGCLSRRAFVSQSVLIAAAAALAACGVSDGGVTQPSSIGASIKVSDYPALASVGGIATVSVSGASLAIVRTSDTQFVALSRVCPHQGGRIDPNGAGFRCTNHGATFDSTGRWTGGERTTNMHAYATSYDPTTGLLTIS